MKFLKQKLLIFILLLIVFFGFLVRVYKLDKNPPSLSWDEVAVGYNGYTIANFGKDEWGKTFPLYFKSFEDDKNPVHIYTTSIFIKFFGLSDLIVRLPSVLFGVINIFVIYLLGKVLYNNYVGLIASFFLAISPYNIHFSRFNHEFNFALCFFLLGLYFFFKAVKQKYPFFLIISFLAFGIDLFTYHPAKIITPLIVGLLVPIYFNPLWKIKKYFLASLIILIVLLSIILSNPALLGFARANQTRFSQEALDKTYLYAATNQELLGRIEIAIRQYPLHFTPEYLFFKGDKNPRLADQVSGQFYLIDLPLIVLGLIFLLLKFNRLNLILIFWFLISPIPSSLTDEAPHAARLVFLSGVWPLVSGYGYYQLLSLIKFRYVKVGFTILLICLSIFSFTFYSQRYWREYEKKSAIDWQFGMKEVVNFVKSHPEYGWVYTTKDRAQPYIFFLYYLKVPLNIFRETVEYNDGHDRSANLVTFFDKYHFGDWDFVESLPVHGVLYILTSSQLGGLRYLPRFDIKQTIHYPDGGVAFYLVSAK